MMDEGDGGGDDGVFSSHFSDDVDEDDDFEDHDVDVDDDEDTLISSHNPLRTSFDFNKNHITSVKASGAYKNCKPCSESSNHNRTNAAYADSEAGSGTGRFNCGKEMEARLKGLSSGRSTPASYSDRIESIKFVVEDEVKEWVAQVEPGVLITFQS
ncbi:putative brevis radix (BRX) domain, protein BREVIS RADIX [Helianthus annuus]|nr:putative brevis radix (BRX) domain, protein BREVIS RADIX [Helianthus annuus]